MEEKFEFEYVFDRKEKEIIDSLDLLVKDWFFYRFKEFSATQKHGVLPIFERKSILISAPTGGTKTLTAFLSILNYLVSLARKNELENRVYAVYCSPLKALSNDIFVNLEQPLKEIEEIYEKNPKKYYLANKKNEKDLEKKDKRIKKENKKTNLGEKLQKIRVGLRTGDTSVSERAKLAKNAPHILVTTPESLAIMINSPKFSEYFKMVEFAIVDEIHSLAENKRGVHFSLTLERLQELSIIPLTRIGLSATVAPLKKVAHYLVGSENFDKNERKESKKCLIASVELEKKAKLDVLSPVDDFLETDTASLNTKLYKLIDDLVQKNKTTLIFTNTRAATERIVHNLKEHFPKNYSENIGAHHGSLSKEHRFDIEKKLRKGDLKVVVCSTSLELGIDIGFIDLVILLGSPKGVARAMQRIGRAGHQLHSDPHGKFVVYDVDDMVECALIMKNAKEKVIDKVHIPENCLDVLAQHIYGMAIGRVWNVDEMFLLIKKSYCYRNLSKEDFFSVISYLAGEYDLDVRNLYPKIWYDSNTREIGKRGKLARVIYMTNIGTIPDQSFLSVVLRDGTLVGKLDEGFLERMKKNDVFVLGGNKYQYKYSKGMKVYVDAAPNKRPTIPSWFSEMLPLSFDTALSIQKFRRLVSEMFENKKSKEEIKEFIKKYVYCNAQTSESIYNYFEKQFKFSLIPHERKILIEEFRNGDRNYIIFHTLFGRRVNDALSRIVGYLVGIKRNRDVEVGMNDNGFFIAGKTGEFDLQKVEKEFRALKSKSLRDLLEEAINKTDVLKRRFRHAAGRGLMILRNYKGRTKSVGRQQMSSHFLLSAVEKKTKDFPILKEARREVLEDLMDIKSAEEVVRRIEMNEIRIEKKNTKNFLLSPFAINLILQSHADVIRIEDKIDFIKRVYGELERNSKN